jgi:hypothetical protein
VAHGSAIPPPSRTPSVLHQRPQVLPLPITAPPAPTAPLPIARGGTAPRRLLGLTDDSSCSDLLPLFPVPGGHTAFLLCDLPPPSPLTPRIPASESCLSPAAVSSVFSEFRDPAPSPTTPDDAVAAHDEPRDLGFDDDDSFDADSILCSVNQSAAEGIDGIMGKLSMENNEASGSSSSVDSNMLGSKMHPYLRNLMVLGLSFR